MAIAFIKKGRPNKLELFKSILKSTLEERFHSFITDTGPSNEEGKALAAVPAHAWTIFSRPCLTLRQALRASTTSGACSAGGGVSRTTLNGYSIHVDWVNSCVTVRGSDGQLVVVYNNPGSGGNVAFSSLNLS